MLGLGLIATLGLRAVLVGKWWMLDLGPVLPSGGESACGSLCLIPFPKLHLVLVREGAGADLEHHLALKVPSLSCWGSGWMLDLALTLFLRAHLALVREGLSVGLGLTPPSPDFILLWSGCWGYGLFFLKTASCPGLGKGWRLELYYFCS